MNSASALLARLKAWIAGIVAGALVVGAAGFAWYAIRGFAPEVAGRASAAVLRSLPSAEANAAAVRQAVTSAVASETSRLVVVAVAGVVVLGLLIAAAAAVVLRRQLTRPLGSTLDQLTDGAERISGHAANVSRDAGGLASVTSKAAAGIEEIASTVEELASMTQRNADHSTETDRLMQEARATMTEADASMHGLLAAIQSIRKQSAETSKIIQTIDEIAFQTNLLALNAAIEAARAGEHGASFGVVADEVRTLARHAAEAARNTATLIEQTNHEVGRAVSVVETTSRQFEAVNGRVLKSSGFVSQIAQASAEQARGIDQLNTSVGKIESVLQQTVANAEHSTTAAEQMIDESATIETGLAALRGALGVERGAATAAATSARPVLKIAVSSLVAESLDQWTQRTPLLAIERFDTPFANRPTVDLILQLQALAAGGLDFDYELSVHANHGRAVIEVAQGYADLTAESVWDSEIRAAEDTFLATSAVIRNGEFEKGLYTAPTNQRMLSARLPEQFAEFVGVTVFNWSIDVQLLENLGLRRIERVSRNENMFQLVHEGRADFALLEFGASADLSVENNGIRLVPVPECKVALPGSRSWVISRRSCHADLLVRAFEQGIGAMRRDGRFERAYGESGFFNPKVAHWRTVSDSAAGTPRPASPEAAPSR